MKSYIPTKRKFPEYWYFPIDYSLRIQSKKRGLKIHKFHAIGT